jgi:bifunctional oligoribonuclease and PAP phosphatase NrnA
MQDIAAFKKHLSTPKNIIITTHQKPDADALGSSLGLAGFLKKKGHQVQVVTPTDYPAFLNWMAGNDEVIIFNEGNENKTKALIEKADMIFCLDFSSLARIGDMGEMVGKSKAVKVLIDHHLDPEDFADFAWWSTKAAATAELIYELIVDLGEEDLIDQDIAEALYAGIMTDTGSFRHPNTTKNVHLITAALIDFGANIAKVGKLVYDTNSLNRLKFLGFALSERLVVLEEYKTAYFAISAQDLERFDSRTGDTEGIVNYALSIENIVLAAVIIERPEAIKISFRSVGDFPVNEFSRDHFDGGGHKNASGGKSDLPLHQTVDKFKDLLEQYKEQLISTNQKLKINV